jgi:hypothetical protein
MNGGEGSDCKGGFYADNGLHKNGHDKDFEIEQAKQFTDMIEQTKGKVVAPQDKRLQ